MVRQDNIQLVRENNHIKQACEELRRLHDDDQREVADMRLLQKQVPVLFTVGHLPYGCRKVCGDVIIEELYIVGDERGHIGRPE